MKLLLTSGGLTNKSITGALFDLVGKKPEDTFLVFIPTASNVEVGDKGWLIDDLSNLKKQDFKSIDIADISAVSEKIWRPKIEAADVLFFEGGNAFHLMEWVNKSGLREILPEFLKTKVYVGSSAGSMVTNKDLALKLSQIIYEEDFDKTEDMPGLNYVDFYFLPHLNSEYFPKVREKNVQEAIKGMTAKIYALDDQSALKVVDGNVEVVSEGQYLIFN
ncbi:MAG: Type 1 glutamine amidotransferase-like domain-containing protein [Candidatus Sungbacteria bacterium]|nr:Type 1 glutamine amidotransferase-like domain-containing protein [Parcubacteria group bacterium]MBI2639380.1 Type 1 glutamine amidotransferase-like domain-containing protein [Candidatus Sungbacteria bacterium]